MAEEEEQESNAGPRSFARFIENAGDGDFHRDISSEMKSLMDELRAQSYDLNVKVKGKLAITLNLSCDPRGIVGVDIDSKVTKPKRKRPTAQAWVNGDGNIVFQDPRQQSLPLREVNVRRGLRELEDKEREAREV